MTAGMLLDYGCPECGYDGPHTLILVEAPGEPDRAECGDSECAAEFEVRP